MQILMCIFLIAIGIAIVLAMKYSDEKILRMAEEKKRKDESCGEAIDGSVVTTKSIDVIVSAKLKARRLGRIVGLFGFLLTFVLWLVYFFFGEVTVLQAGMINAYTLTAGAALLSFFGLIFGDASSMLLAAVALIWAFILEWESFPGLVPAILLMISNVRMKKAYKLKSNKEKMEYLTLDN